MVWTLVQQTAELDLSSNIEDETDPVIWLPVQSKAEFNNDSPSVRVNVPSETCEK